MKSDFINGVFFCTCFSLMFNNVPKSIQMNFIGGPVGSKLVFYPLVVGMIYTFWCEWKYNKAFINCNVLKKYFGVYIGTSLVSLLLGLYTYPYWNLVFSGPVDQIEKLPKVLSLFEAYGINVDSQFIISIWIVVRQIKGIFLEFFWCFGGAYLVYCWYKDNWKTGFKIACWALIASLGIFIVYGIIDAMYLHGNLWAKNFLVAVNPYIHPIQSNNGWWPPLLWKNQLRSVFVEPSHVGNYLALVFPVLLYYCLKYKNTLSLFLVGCVSFLVVLTKARTAYAMVGGMLLLFVIMVLLLGKNSWRQIVAVFLAAFIGFYSGIGFFKSLTSNEKMKQAITAEFIIDQNLSSLAASDKRSNGARYALIKCNLRIAVQHPLFGVGSGLGLAYMLENYTDEERNNQEVADWINRSYKYGVFAAGQGYGDAMNEYITRLSNRGIVGLLVFLLPFIYIILRLYKLKDSKYKLETLTLIIMIISSLVAGCNGSINLIYGVWIPLGLGYAMCFGKEYDDKEIDERA